MDREAFLVLFMISLFVFHPTSPETVLDFALLISHLAGIITLYVECSVA